MTALSNDESRIDGTGDDVILPGIGMVALAGELVAVGLTMVVRAIAGN